MDNNQNNNPTNNPSGNPSNGLPADAIRTASPKRIILIALAAILAILAIVAIVALGAEFRRWLTPSGGDTTDGTPGTPRGGEQEEALPPLSVPEAWKDAKGEVNIPKDITSPIEAVGQVTQVKGYENASSVRAFLGDDGEWYWEVQTPNGVMTVKGKAPGQ